MNQELRISPAQAKYVLEQLLSDRRINQTDINRALGKLQTEIAHLEEKLRGLRASSTASLPSPPKPTGTPKAQRREGAKRRVRRAVSPERLASMKLQGQFLSLLRQQRKSERARFKALAKEKGREVAIAAMQKAKVAKK